MSSKSSGASQKSTLWFSKEGTPRVCCVLDKRGRKVNKTVLALKNPQSKGRVWEANYCIVCKTVTQTWTGAQLFNCPLLETGNRRNSECGIDSLQKSRKVWLERWHEHEQRHFQFLKWTRLFPVPGRLSVLISPGLPFPELPAEESHTIQGRTEAWLFLSLTTCSFSFVLCPSSSHLAPNAMQI